MENHPIKVILQDTQGGKKLEVEGVTATPVLTAGRYQSEVSEITINVESTVFSQLIGDKK